MPTFSCIEGPNYNCPQCGRTGKGCHSRGYSPVCVVHSSSHSLEEISKKDLQSRLRALEGYVEVMVMDKTIDSILHRDLLLERANLLGLKKLDYRQQREILQRAKSATSGIGIKRKGSRKLSAIEIPFLWDGIIPANRSTCVVGLPKTFKSTTVIHMVAAWFRGESSFLGHELVGECPPLVIVGTDQNEADWVTTLAGAGLPTEIDADGVSSPIVEIWTAEQGLYLNPEGIEEVRKVVADYPDALILVDSIRKTVGAPLGIEEKEVKLIEPLQAFELALAPYNPTIIYIHHSGKGRATDNPILASGGTTALPGHVSNMIGLAKMNEAEDSKIRMWIDGRCGPEKQIYYRRTDESFEIIATGPQHDALVKMEAAERQLNNDQIEVLEVLRQRSVDCLASTSSDIAEALGKDPVIKNNINWVNRKLKSLELRNLAVYDVITTNNTSKKEWLPVQLPSTIEYPTNFNQSSKYPNKPNNPNTACNSNGVSGVSGVLPSVNTEESNKPDWAA